MDYNKPTLLVVSGPNGAGKSTYIASMLPDEFVDALPFDRDLTRTRFSKELHGQYLSPEQVTSHASMMMEEYLSSKINTAITNRDHFVLETPLSHPDYWRYIDRFEKHGYQIQLNYFCLDDIQICKQRVGQRVKEGGHAVDARTIKGVYEQNLKFINEYWNAFNCIYIYDSTWDPYLLAVIDNGVTYFYNHRALKTKWLINGMPTIAKLIKDFSS
ncbi:zeta toxin family protein [Chitinophaga sp. Cy-1792]|uniref:zeta toxin family protein n=1 Tax=Chitinophaga sp. Cy-1792 TaxID=2608339 RepID=UPI00142429EA|nr:zeta toxin family protein [Chitinophaga sp. Cy-1792]NIG57587.1 AAA family ATPase [Chitinophaga sp. Cy-1792]